MSSLRKERARHPPRARRVLHRVRSGAPAVRGQIGQPGGAAVRGRRRGRRRARLAGPGRRGPRWRSSSGWARRAVPGSIAGPRGSACRSASSPSPSACSSSCWADGSSLAPGRRPRPAPAQVQAIFSLCVAPPPPAHGAGGRRRARPAGPGGGRPAHRARQGAPRRRGRRDRRARRDPLAPSRDLGGVRRPLSPAVAPHRSGRGRSRPARRASTPTSSRRRTRGRLGPPSARAAPLDDVLRRVLASAARAHRAPGARRRRPRSGGSPRGRSGCSPQPTMRCSPVALLTSAALALLALLAPSRADAFERAMACRRRRRVRAPRRTAGRTRRSAAACTSPTGSRTPSTRSPRSTPRPTRGDLMLLGASAGATYVIDILQSDPLRRPHDRRIRQCAPRARARLASRAATGAVRGLHPVRHRLRVQSRGFAAGFAGKYTLLLPGAGDGPGAISTAFARAEFLWGY